MDQIVRDRIDIGPERKDRDTDDMLHRSGLVFRIEFKHTRGGRFFCFFFEIIRIRVDGEIREIGGKTVESAELFDIYRGPQVGENKKSVSFSVSLRASDKTLNDEEADGAVKKILKVLEKELGITLRA